MDTIFGIPAGLLGNIGSTGLLALFVVATLTGRLVPQSVLQHGHALFELRVSESRKEVEVWREAYARSEDARRLLAEQAQASVELAEDLGRLLENATRAVSDPDPRRNGMRRP